MLQVGFVRPHLAADPTPNLARPPLISIDNPDALSAWRDAYRAGPPPAAVWRENPRGGRARTWG